MFPLHFLFVLNMKTWLSPFSIFSRYFFQPTSPLIYLPEIVSKQPKFVAVFSISVMSFPEAKKKNIGNNSFHPNPNDEYYYYYYSTLKPKSIWKVASWHVVHVKICNCGMNFTVLKLTVDSFRWTQKKRNRIAFLFCFSFSHMTSLIPSDIKFCSYHFCIVFLFLLSLDTVCRIEWKL